MSMQTEQLQEMFRVVMNNGPTFSGGNETQGRYIASEWSEYGFTPAQADEWMSAGFWLASVAADIREAGMSATHAMETEKTLIKSGESFTDNSPIYAMCNGDYSVDDFIAAFIAN